MYINLTKNQSGAYPAPQSTAAPGMIPLTDEQADMVLAYNGFVELTIEDVAIQIDGESLDMQVQRIVTAVTPNTEAWEAWKASLPPDPDPAPTTEERITALEAENNLLKAQVAARSDQMDFYEDCIAEMASVVYA